MEIQPDFKELLILFNKHAVDFLIVGGYAVAMHGAPRFTGDIDLYINPVAENAKRILMALAEFGFAALDLNESDFQKPDYVVQLGVPPVRVDILTSISGVSWSQAWQGKVTGKYDDLSVFYLGRNDLIINKKATGRLKDLADVDALQ